MKLLLIALLTTSFAINAQDNDAIKKPIALDLKLDVNKMAQGKFGHLIEDEVEQKNIFDRKPPRYKTTVGLAFGNTGSTIQEGNQPLTIKNPNNIQKPTTIFEK